MRTYELFLKAFSVPSSVIIVLIFNRYVYKMPILIGTAVVVSVVFVLYKMIEKIPIAQKEMSKNMKHLLPILAFSGIFFSFIVFDI